MSRLDAGAATKCEHRQFLGEFEPKSALCPFEEHLEAPWKPPGNQPGNDDTSPCPALPLDRMAT